jgi:leucyl aminopeptidase
MKISLHDTIPTATEVIVFPFVQGEHLKTQIEQIAARFDIPSATILQDFKANFKETLPLYVAGEMKKVYFLGIGDKANFPEFLAAFRSFTHHQKGKIPAKITVDIAHLGEDNLPIRIEAIANGMTLGRYSIALHKSIKPEAPEFANGKAEVSIVSVKGNDADLKKIVENAIDVAETQMRIFDLVNQPANHKTSTILANWAEESGKKYGYDVTTFVGRDELEKLGCHAINAVNKGSAEAPALIVMEYKPKKAKKDAPIFGFVGKGVTFDTGGISIKPSANMSFMKSDMGGAAAVFGLMEAVAKLKLPIHIVGIVPSTDNCVDGAGTKPSEVFGSYLGKTIEMIDTDAEGRLVLADGLAYLNKNYKPTQIIDLATLTGSVIAALGYAAAGMYTNNEEMAENLYKTGLSCGEKVWRLPLWDFYKDDLNSDIADIKNLSGKPVAGSITAAKFLEAFTENHPAWVHLDIAGMAFGDSEFSQMRSGTAYGVRLLIEYLKKNIEEA